MNLHLLVKLFESYHYIDSPPDAFHYYWSYTHFLDFDNIYVTYLFEKVDKHRWKKRLEYVLPIKSFEKDTYISPYSALLTKADKATFYNKSAIILYEFTIVHIFMSVLRIHATQAAQMEVARSIKAMYALIEEGSLEIFQITGMITHLGFIEFFTSIYIVIYLLAFHSIFTKRYRPVVCGLRYPQIEESRAMALYHTILVRRQDLFDIRCSLLLDRLAYEESPEAKSNYFLRFNWWKGLSSAYGRMVKYLHAKIITKIYEYCALCGDYGKKYL